jgi:flagellar biogenesis protein FliO
MGKIGRIPAAAAILLLLSLSLLPAGAAEDTGMVLSHGGKNRKLDLSEELPASQAVSASSASPNAAFLRTAGMALLLLAAVAGAATWVYKRQGMKGLGGAKAQKLALVERLSLGPQRELLLVKAGGKLLVVGSQANQLSLLTELPTEESQAVPFREMLARRTEPATTSQERAALTSRSRSSAGEPEPVTRDTVVAAPTAQAVNAAYAWPEVENVA